MRALVWHRLPGTEGAPYDYVTEGYDRNFLAVNYPYGWHLFYLPHKSVRAGGPRPITVSEGPWARLKDAKAHAQLMEQYAEMHRDAAEKTRKAAVKLLGRKVRTGARR